MNAFEKKIAACLFAAVTLGSAAAQIRHVPPESPQLNVIIPQGRARAFTAGGANAVEITGVEALIDITESTATTTIEIRLHNKTGSRQEAELVFPVPPGSVIRGFSYDGPGGPVTAVVLPREEARRIYDRLVSKIRDPALVEFVGYNLIRSSVFPIEPNGDQALRLTYEHLLDTDGGRVDYTLPRTESLRYAVPWKFTANITAKRPISTVYSASHEINVKRISETRLSVTVAAAAATEPGPFRLSYLLQEDGVTASMFAYPDDKVGGGYFLLLAGMPADAAARAGADSIKREVTLVIDRSGSMRNDKMEQVKEAALQVIAGLDRGEAFNVIIYSNTVEQFSAAPVIKTPQTEQAARRYVETITPTGGTNIYDALLSALAQKPSGAMLPIVLFLTDGLPTIGQTSEAAIRKLATESNPYSRRIFTFGVGVDLNAPLLEKIAGDSRAKAEFVLPGEDVEVKVGRLFKGLSGPVLADPQLAVTERDGTFAAGRTRDITPAVLPDLFEGDQLVLLGQYVGSEPVTFNVSGNYRGRRRTFRFTFEFDNASGKNGFVPRLWAGRKIAELIDEVRQMGADPAASADDPKAAELVDEIVRLSTEFGILTEYTAFLAREGTDLSDSAGVMREAGSALESLAMRQRSGPGAVSQSYNMIRRKNRKTLNIRNYYLDAEMAPVSVEAVQQVNDRAYYRRGGRWVDSRLVNERAELKPARVVEFGSDEFMELARRLALRNRQASMALGGDVLLLVDGEVILVKAPGNE
jgi:Ca-activated chloride channel family protein